MKLQFHQGAIMMRTNDKHRIKSEIDVEGRTLGWMG